jgi:hypothetical protein
VAGSCGYGNETWGSVKDREFVDHLSDYQLVKDSALQFIKRL